MKSAVFAWLLALGSATAWGSVPPTATASFQHGRLYITFDEAMRTWPNKREDELVALHPALPINCGWQSDTVIYCTPADDGQVFRSATRYRIELGLGFETQQGISVPARDLFAESARPSLTSFRAEWHRGKPTIVFYANEDTEPDSISAALRLTVDAQPRPLPALARIPSDNRWISQVEYRLRIPDVDGHDRQVEISIVPGLRSRQGPLRGTQNLLQLSLLVNEQFSIRDIRCSDAKGSVVVARATQAFDITCFPGEPVWLAFSQPMNPSSKEAFLGSLPRGVRMLDREASHVLGSTYSAESGALNRPPHVVALQIDQVSSVTKLETQESWLSDQGDAFSGPEKITIRTSEPRSQLRGAARAALIADGSRLPVLAESLNSPRLEFDEQAVADVAHIGSFEVRENRRRKPRLVSSRETLNALADGGWARWVYTGKRRHGAAAVVEFAAPQFDLFAMVGHREVLVWANHWDGSGPVANAEVELLWLPDVDSAPQVAASGTTGHDGTVALRLHDDFYIEVRDPFFGTDGPRWLVRAATKKDAGNASRAVLPLRTHGGDDLGKPVSVRVWGVTDRPLYRAGDIVRYQLWVREQRGRRLRAPRSPAALDIRLTRAYSDETLVSRPDQPDANGLISGQLTLPLHAPDSDYCIGVPYDYEVQGACFYVGTYRAQDLWVELALEGNVLRDGETVHAQAEAGYYSGGGAAGVDLVPTTMLTGYPVELAYPAYSGYIFTDVMTPDAADGIALPTAEGKTLIADENGKAHAEWPLKFEPDVDGVPVELPAFGQLQVVVEAKLSEREGTASPMASVFYARYDQFVGLRLKNYWLNVGSDVVLEAVVVGADGVLVKNAPVQVEIRRETAGGSAGVPIAHCQVVSGQSATCDFEREAGARYSFTASSGSAAPATLTRHVWGDAIGPATKNRMAPELMLLSGPSAAGQAATVMLQQPYRRAWVLMVVESRHGTRHTVQAAAGLSTPITIATEPDWDGDVHVRAFVLERDSMLPPSSTGYRTASKILEAELHFELEKEAPDEPVVVAFNSSNAQPAATVQVTVRNTQLRPRHVVLAVIDDAVRALAHDQWAWFDPFGPGWLGHPDLTRTDWTFGSFADWSSSSLVSIGLPWPDGSGAVEYVGDFDGLDRIEVVGSRIKRIEAFPSSAGVPRIQGLQPREHSDALPLASVRSRFADAALWQPGIVLGPGESRSFEVRLPDNLTRWRAVAWSSDLDDDFAMTDAIIEVGRPLEVRLQTPVRIYPDDRAGIAANVRSMRTVAVTAAVRIAVESDEGSHAGESRVTLAAQGQDSTGIEIRPQATGDVQATAYARLDDDADAVTARIEVASPSISARKVQAGWLADKSIELRLPDLPEGASDAELKVTVHDGSTGLVRRWLGDMRDYTHRCWEQILSRAVAAAIAIDAGETAIWPDADDVVAEALVNAPFFMNEDGEFRYFIEERVWLHDSDAEHRNIALTAYSIEAFAFLEQLGHVVNPTVQARATAFLADALAETNSRITVDELAMAAAAGIHLEKSDLERLWAGWARQSRRGQIATARVLESRGDQRAAEARIRLLAAAPRQGAARRLDATDRDVLWMGSSLWAQCALIDLVRDHPQSQDAPRLQSELLAGITDLYAGGMSAIDTQAGAQCLQTFRSSLDANQAEIPRLVRLQLGERVAELEVGPGADTAEWQGSASSGDSLRIEPVSASIYPLSYTAELNYQEDARRAHASAVGLSVDRSYDVLRDGQWHPIGEDTVREGDWVRINLVVNAGATRYFVAVMDELPGGLQPVDLSLEGVAGMDVQRIADPGSYWFDTRKLDARQPRFYAELLPGGRHTIRYFARATSVGNYLAPPASVELMYGNASTARTAAERLQIARSKEQH